MNSIVIFLALVPLVFAAGAASITGCSASLSYTSGGPTISAFATCTNTDSNQSGTVSRTSTSITNSQTGLYEFKFKGTFTNNCPLCQDYYGCNPPKPLSCWSIMRTDTNPDQYVTGGCYSGGSPNSPTYLINPSFSNTQPYTGYFPGGSTFGVQINITSGSGSCASSLSDFILVVNQPAKK
jgi:hypothetical protein